MKQMIKRILAIIIVAVMLMTNINLGVSSKDSKDLQDKIDKTKEQLKDVNKEKTNTEKQVDNIQNKINEYQGSIDSLNDKLDTLNNIHKNQIEAELFNKYIAGHSTDKGIELKRVLYGIVAKK